MKLTKAQVANLRHVREFGRPTPRSRAGFSCRKLGLSEFVWKWFSGKTGPFEAPLFIAGVPGDFPVRIVGEQITPAGRRALSEAGHE